MEGAIVIFAKCPISGCSKTRLSTLLSSDGCASFAQAMLSDVLCSISQHVSFDKNYLSEYSNTYIYVYI